MHRRRDVQTMRTHLLQRETPGIILLQTTRLVRPKTDRVMTNLMQEHRRRDRTLRPWSFDQPGHTTVGIRQLPRHTARPAPPLPNTHPIFRKHQPRNSLIPSGRGTLLRRNHRTRTQGLHSHRFHPPSRDQVPERAHRSRSDRANAPTTTPRPRANEPKSIARPPEGNTSSNRSPLPPPQEINPSRSNNTPGSASWPHTSTPTRSNFNDTPPSTTPTPGQGVKPCTRRRHASADSKKSIHPSALLSFGASVTNAGSCASPTSVPPTRRSNTSNTTPTPSNASTSCNSPAVNDGSSARPAEPSTSPASISSASVITLTPVRASPARIAALIGAAPRQRGNSEACRFTAKRSANSERPNFCPKAITTQASASQPRIISRTPDSFTRSGFNTATPGNRSAAKPPTGVGVNTFPRPEGRSGCVTTPTTSCTSHNAPSVGNPKAPEPKYTTRIASRASMPRPRA